MQKPGKLNLVMYQGATWNYELVWTIGGTAINLTDYQARMQVRPSYDSPKVVLSLDDTDGITLGGTAGNIYLEYSATNTAGVARGQYVYDLELESDTGEVTRLVEGLFEVSPEVTR
jgi:hypothetical protein